MSCRPLHLGSILTNEIRQMNMDYAICNALNYHTDSRQRMVVIYDIVCQWIINFYKRLAQSNHLDIPDEMDIIAAIGKFHLNAHVRECFAKFTLNFVQGVGQLDGEILETLWASFNKICGSARTMSRAHRSEVYSDFMRESNWKKLVGMSE